MEAKEKMNNLETEEEKEAMRDWMKKTPEEKKKFMGSKDKGYYNEIADTFAIKEFLELDFVTAIEEELECSGFCKTALFYWE